MQLLTPMWLSSELCLSLLFTIFGPAAPKGASTWFLWFSKNTSQCRASCKKPRLHKWVYALHLQFYRFCMRPLIFVMPSMLSATISFTFLQLFIFPPSLRITFFQKSASRPHGEHNFAKPFSALCIKQKQFLNPRWCSLNPTSSPFPAIFGTCDFQKTIASAERAEKTLCGPDHDAHLHQNCELQDASFVTFLI